MKIGVLGLGLIGGSIFKKLRELGLDVIGISASQKGEGPESSSPSPACPAPAGQPATALSTTPLENLAQVPHREIFSGIFGDIGRLGECDVVFVCTAMNKCLEALDKLEAIMPETAVVTDVCSLKSFVCKKKRPYRFIPSHPMAGTEHKGFEHSFPELFAGAKWVLTPVFGDEGLEILRGIIEQLGAATIITTPEKHDEAAALISHMPMIVAQGLFMCAEDNELALEMASSGFRDMTRLALSNEEMANDMFTMNSANIQNGILKLYKSLGELTHGNYSEKIKEIKAQRGKMFH